MSETAQFLAATTEQVSKAEWALHDGDPAPRRALWSHEADVTLFGAVVSARGWDEVGSIFDDLARTFSEVTHYENEILTAGASGDLAYTVALEHAVLSVAGRPPRAQLLRVTTLYRREQGEWKTFHRHGDVVTPESLPTLRRLTARQDELPASDEGLDTLRHRMEAP